MQGKSQGEIMSWWVFREGHYIDIYESFKKIYKNWGEGRNSECKEFKNERKLSFLG